MVNELLNTYGNDGKRKSVVPVLFGERSVRYVAGMPDTNLHITLGVEEEFFLVSPESRDLIADPDPAIFDACERASGPHTVVRELLRSQIETNTRVCATFADLREALTETRRVVIDAARHHEIAVIASSTHPSPTGGCNCRRRRSGISALRLLCRSDSPFWWAACIFTPGSATPIRVSGS